MNDKGVEVFGGERCGRVATVLISKGFRPWVFSICSDSRLQQGLESRLLSLHRDDAPRQIVILGDFRTLPPEKCPASFEAIRLIAKACGYFGWVEVCWVNGESIDPENNFAMDLDWHRYNFDNFMEPAVNPIDFNVLFPEERSVIEEIVSLVGAYPALKVTEGGRVRLLDFSDGKEYRRSLIYALDRCKLKILGSLLLKFKFLDSLRFGFSGLKDLSFLSGLRGLKFLDVRGNPKIDMSSILEMQCLEKLNAAACEIELVPDFIEKMSSLKTLLLHKNFIGDVSNISFPPGLERLSLYRNSVKSESLDLSRCMNIEEVNIGANPYRRMAISLKSGAIKMDLIIRNSSKHVTINGVDLSDMHSVNVIYK
ncbi:leucine-rich repeat domain-containing protein [Alcanivorax sp. IL3]|uniref:leucine-rich repeat domain-containing protein n=1 Tax=unclassified Alcanivorax TaxID=2638842 RepID=UPI0039C360A2